MPTGSNARITADKLRKWKSTMMRNGDERIPCGLDVTVFQQRFVFVKLDGHAGDIGINRPQFADEIFLIFALPDIRLWDKPASGIFRPHPHIGRATPAANPQRATARCHSGFAKV